MLFYIKQEESKKDVSGTCESGLNTDEAQEAILEPDSASSMMLDK